MVIHSGHRIIRELSSHIPVKRGQDHTCLLRVPCTGWRSQPLARSPPAEPSPLAAPALTLTLPNNRWACVKSRLLETDKK